MSLLATGVAVLMAPSWAIAAESPANGTANATQDGSDQIVVTGTRRNGRTVTNSSAAIDVISAEQLASVPASDLNAKLSLTTPSFAVQTKALYTTKVYIRPAGLRGLPADSTLVLVNGKRQHRTAVVDFNSLGGGVQGTDLSQIPSAAIARAEVLRDGASAQYGSDAIAGVINLILKDDPGLSGYTQWGKFYAGDGESFQTALNGGVRLGDRGVLTASFEYTRSLPTSRSLQRQEALNAIAAGNANIRQPAVTTWGSPDVTLYRLAVNGHYDLSDSAQLYAFGLYGDSVGSANVNWRGPANASLRASVFQAAPYNIDPTYSAISRFPGGFTPFFETKGRDFSIVGGLKGKLSDRLNYDVSVNYGGNSSEYYTLDSYNASLGRVSPTDFYGGKLDQRELNFNADLVYTLDAGLYSPLNIAFGGELRRETFAAAAGEAGSYMVGVYPDLPSGASGGVAITPDAVGKWGRNSQAAYVDIDADVSRALSLGVAGRFEHYGDFGDTWNGKASARWKIAPGFNLRGTVSTGFRAPTPGQQHSVNTTLTPDLADPGSIVTQTLLSVTSPIAISLGAKPLKPEKAVSESLGVVLQPFRRLTFTLDGYNIDIRDRLSISQLFAVSRTQRYTFFVNGYRTNTRGLDAVLTYDVPLGEARKLSLIGSLNYNRTKVRSFRAQTVTAAQIINIEDHLPRLTMIGSLQYTDDRWDIQLRGRHYSHVTDLYGDLAIATQRLRPETFFDASASYALTGNIRLTVGAENIFDHYPQRVFYGGPVVPGNIYDAGRKYGTGLPYSFDGGKYYVRASFNL